MYLFCPATISLPDICKNKVVVVVVVEGKQKRGAGA